MNRFRAWAPALAWMGVIFVMSAMPGDMSGETSGTLARMVLGAVSFLFGQEAAAGIPMDMVNLFVRKGAHMTEYAVLFWLYCRALRIEGAKRPVPIALLLCAVYAATDEFHQSFVADRGPSVVDVCIDTLGAAIAWGLTELYTSVTKKER